MCEVVLSSHALDNEEGLGLHRVVVLGVENNNVYFHDPRKKLYLPKRQESLEHFEQAWLGAVEAPELCIYRK